MSVFKEIFFVFAKVVSYGFLDTKITLCAFGIYNNVNIIANTAIKKFKSIKMFALISIFNM